MRKFSIKPKSLNAMKWFKPGDHPNNVEIDGKWYLKTEDHFHSSLQFLRPNYWIVELTKNTLVVLDEHQFDSLFNLKKKLQCKHIPDRPILEFLAKRPGRWHNWFGNEYDNSVTLAMPMNLPSKLVRAKMKRLVQRKMVNGCCCGCRGDFEISPEGQQWLNDTQIDEINALLPKKFASHDESENWLFSQSEEYPYTPFTAMWEGEARRVLDTVLAMEDVESA